MRFYQDESTTFDKQHNIAKPTFKSWALDFKLFKNLKYLLLRQDQIRRKWCIFLPCSSNYFC